ncbi:MAG: TIM-barrel domain-containing protein [Oscillospiraceae bacterium]
MATGSRREAYTTQEELVQVAEEYRRRGVPLDCVVQDWNSWRPGLWGDKHLDPARYPDMADASRRLHAMNVHSVVSIWPNMAEGAPDHEEMAQAGALLGDLSTYDAFQPAARALYWKQLTRELVPAGFDGWWCEFDGAVHWVPTGAGRKSVPRRSVIVWWPGSTRSSSTRRRRICMRCATRRESGGPAGLLSRQARGQPDPLGCAGSQRYGTILWSGDISAFVGHHAGNSSRRG